MAEVVEYREVSLIGRPTDYAQDVCDEICERIADGESLRSICRDEHMPCKATVFRWLGLHKEFSDQYARAKEAQADSYEDDMLEIANHVGTPLMVDGFPLLKDGQPVMIVDAASVNHARLKIDTMKWIASKLKPKKYGDSVQVKGAGENGEHLHKVVDEAPKLSKEEWLLAHGIGVKNGA